MVAAATVEMVAMAEMVAMEAMEATVDNSLSRRVFRLIAVSVLPLTGFAQNAPGIALVPGDPLELVTGPAHAAVTPQDREAALQLLGRARNNFTLRESQTAYHLKVRFAVDSLGQTNYDGVWETDDLFDPQQGLRWIAKAASGYVTTRISSNGAVHGEGTASLLPLRLHEARGLLYDPLPSPAYAGRGSIRAASATFHGALVTCLLLARSLNPTNPPMGRGWEENEECIDPQSGLLQMHSEAPGRYVVYDYAKGPQLGGRVLPRTVTVTEAGRVVSRISVEGLEEIAPPDPSLYVPTGAMNAAGEAPAMSGATKMSRVHGSGPLTSAMTVRPVCVFGLVTPAGQLVEAHSLQPSDPNSEVAVEDAKTIDFSSSAPAGASPHQHFVFVIEKFISR
jgi:hypothetical protein